MKEQKILYAKKIIEADRTKLVMEHRFLSYALYALDPKGLSETDYEGFKYATEGINFYYDEKRLIRDFMKGETDTSCIYLHSVLHCLYLHPFFAERYAERGLWNLACDILIWNIIGSLGYKVNNELRQILSIISDGNKVSSAQSLYWIMFKMLKKGDLTYKEIDEMQAALFVDDHEFWYMPREDGSAANGSERGAHGGDSSEKQCVAGNFTVAIDKWKNAADHVAVNLETAMASGGAHRGDTPGEFMESLRGIHRDNISYSDFLRKFATLEERMIVDVDAYDYNYYTYGLSLYDDMPLVEPVEYKEMHTIRDFVIAIDTSGSCDTRMVRDFLTKTYNILQETTFAEDRLNVHIIQCDAGIQDDYKIKNRKEMEGYISGLNIYGRGGTDFRPVFDRVEELREEGELRNLKGLLYFTDGDGIYPVKPTDYRTAFIFADIYCNVEVPPWILKYYLREEFE